MLKMMNFALKMMYFAGLLLHADLRHSLPVEASGLY